MLEHFRKKLLKNLQDAYFKSVPAAQKIQDALHARGIHNIPMDHYALIDLPSEKTGMDTMNQIYSSLGYITQGRDYLAEKQNEFLWMVESDAIHKKVEDVLPQVVLADFWLKDLPEEIRKIILSYVGESKACSLAEIQNLAAKVYWGDAKAEEKLLRMLTHYFSGRDWPLPTIANFLKVQAFNELLAWVLVFGRVPNHFTIPIHLIAGFESLEDFNDFVENKVGLKLNRVNGVIKGSSREGLQQSSTVGEKVTVQLADGSVEIADRFFEFVWRFPKAGIEKPVYWKDFFTGFIGVNATHVIESLYD